MPARRPIFGPAVALSTACGPLAAGIARLAEGKRAARQPALAYRSALWQKPPHSGPRCGSSVVEHSLGKGEVESSILSRSTSRLFGAHRRAATPSIDHR